MIKYIRHKSTILSFISDAVILSGVFFFGWSPVRVIAFICLDIEVMIFFFFVFMKYEKEIRDYFSLLFGFTILSIMVLSYFYLLLSLQSDFNLTHRPNLKFDDVINLFSPYYDVAFFILVSGMYHGQIIRNLIKVKNNTDSEAFSLKSILYRMLMIPVTFFIAGYISLLLNTNIYATSFVFFLVMKEIADYWKFKALMKLNIVTE